MIDQNKELGMELCREFDQLRGDRGNFDSHCKEIAERIMPAQSKLFNFGNQGRGSKGEKRTEHIFDSTASIALGRFSSIVDSLLTPRNQIWARIQPSDSKLMKDRATKLWFEESNKILFRTRYAPRANFAANNQQYFKSLGAFGTSTMFVDEMAGGPGIRYRHCHLSEIYFRENHQGVIDTVFRYFPFTARQAFQKWGSACPEKIRNAAKSANPDQNFNFLHIVRPRADRNPERIDAKSMPFASYYVAHDEKTILSESGYTTFPYPTSRYEQAPGEVYGRSPAMDALPAIKTLNEQKKTLLKQGHRTVDPVFLAHDDGIANSFSFKPGAMNAGGVSADGRPLIHTLPVGNVQVGKEMMDDERTAINDVFLVTLFQILMESPQMTATEVMERSREKGILLAPTVGRQETEYLGPLIERELDILQKQRMLPPMPPALMEAQGEYRIIHDSPLSRAQRAEEASGLMRTIEMALNVVNVTQDQSPLQHFNWDVIVPDVSDIQGVPARWMRDITEIKAMRDQAAKQQEMQTAIQAGPAAAAMVKASAVAQKGK